MLHYDIYRLICLHSGIDGLQAICNSATEISFPLYDYQFWLDKFALDDLLLIVNIPTTIHSWITEYIKSKNVMIEVKSFIDTHSLSTRQDVLMILDNLDSSDVKMVLSNYSVMDVFGDFRELVDTDSIKILITPDDWYYTIDIYRIKITIKRFISKEIIDICFRIIYYNIDITIET